MQQVIIADDFDLDKIINSGQCFRPQKLADGRYRFINGQELLYIKPIDDTHYAVDCSCGSWGSVWHDYFDFERSYSQLRSELDSQNDFLQKSLDYGKGIRILHQQPWEMLISFLISQRKSIPAIRTAVEQLASRFGQQVQGSGESVYLFPTAQQLALACDEELQQCGLGYRTRYVKNAAKAVAGGEVDLSAFAALSDEQLFNTLMHMDGVGKKVANCVCLFGYGRTAMVPIDVWIARLIDEEFGGTNPFPQYGGNAGIVQQYMFYYKRAVAKQK